MFVHWFCYISSSSWSSFSTSLLLLWTYRCTHHPHPRYSIRVGRLLRLLIDRIAVQQFHCVPAAATSYPPHPPSAFHCIWNFNPPSKVVPLQFQVLHFSLCLHDLIGWNINSLNEKNKKNIIHYEFLEKALKSSFTKTESLRTNPYLFFFLSLQTSQPHFWAPSYITSQHIIRQPKN